VTISGSWQENLARWQSSDFPGMTLSGNEESMLDLVHNKMQEHYPGNYTLDWKFDIIKGRFVLYPRFDTSEDETWFILKYS
jgi:hypothetical protein